MNNVMNKPGLVEAMAAKAELSKKDTEKALNALLEVVSEELQAGNKIQLVGFGTFEITERKERAGRNPKTGEDIVIPGGKAPKFKPGKQLKDAIKNS